MRLKYDDIKNFSSDISNKEIVYVKNFLSKEDCDHIISLCNDIIENYSDDHNLIGYSNDGKVNKKSAPYVFVKQHPDNKIHAIVENINSMATKLYEDTYGYDPEISYIYLGTVNVMGVGDDHEVHADNVPSLVEGIDTPHGMILYLNDDYEGGQLYYPDFKIAIKPQAGDLVIHPGTKEYAHGVVPVISGTRYVTTAFTKKKLPPQ